MAGGVCFSVPRLYGVRGSPCVLLGREGRRVQRERLLQQSLLAQPRAGVEHAGAPSDPSAQLGPAQLSSLQLTKFVWGGGVGKCSSDPGSSGRFFQKRLATFGMTGLALTVNLGWVHHNTCSRYVRRGLGWKNRDFRSFHLAVSLWRLREGLVQHRCSSASSSSRAWAAGA